MKKTFTFLLSFFYLFSNAQVFTGTGGAILNNGGQETIFNLPVSGLTPAQIDSTFGLMNVTVDIVHPNVNELHLAIMSPWGLEVDLTGVLTVSGANFTGTTFDNSSTTIITNAVGPYTGTFAPVGNLGRFNSAKPGNGTWKLIVKDFIAGPNAGNVVSWSITFGATPPKPVILASSNLPLVFINTNNQSISTNSILIDFGVIDNGGTRNNITDPKNNYNGKAACHVRGSSSKMFEKNNLKIELRDAAGLQTDVSLLGMPAESDWVLTACYSDKTLMRNALSQYIFQQMGHYSPRFRFVELIFNGEYYGVYMLMEKVKRNAQRVNVAKMTNQDNQFPYVTGGYIVQINRTDDPGWYSLYPGLSNTSAKFYYQYEYPRAEDITAQQQGYIKAVMDTFETVMQSPTFNNPSAGYEKYLEVNSFIDYFIINEFSKNPDAYRLSTYLYKDNYMDGGKIHIGPVWDYDISWHNCNFGNASDNKYWQHENASDAFPVPTWWKTFMTDANFKNKLHCRYHTLRQGLLSNGSLNSYLDQLAGLLDEAQKRNYRQFPIMGAYIYPNPQPQAGATYAGEITDLKNWIAARGGWLDGNIPGSCAAIGFAENTSDLNLFNVFPNPFSNTFKIEFLTEKSSVVKIELYNLIGQKIISAKNEKLVKGEYSEVIETDKLESGTYFIKVSIDGRSTTKKIIKM
jgi:subtilisin-like proprotein convertase family protein